MKVSKEALYGIIFALVLGVVLLLFRKPKCDQEKVIITDPSATKAIEDYERRLMMSDSAGRSYKALYEGEKNKEEKIKYIYVERDRAIDRADIRGKDSILRANIGL